jgi:hypothetical protein
MLCSTCSSGTDAIRVAPDLKRRGLSVAGTGVARPRHLFDPVAGADVATHNGSERSIGGHRDLP